MRIFTVFISLVLLCCLPGCSRDRQLLGKWVFDRPYTESQLPEHPGPAKEGLAGMQQQLAASLIPILIEKLDGATLTFTGVAPDTRNDFITPLIQATCRENVDLLRLLLSQHGIKLDETDVDGYTALMWAVKHGSEEITDLLLHAGASAAVTNKQGETAASMAQQEIEKQRNIIAKLNATPK